MGLICTGDRFWHRNWQVECCVVGVTKETVYYNVVAKNGTIVLGRPRYFHLKNAGAFIQ